MLAFKYSLLLSVLLLLTLPGVSQSVKVQYLANHGVLIKGKDKQILIDGAFKRVFDYLDVLPDEELEKIKKAGPMYDSIDIMLATHVHGDHFSSELTGSHLTHSQETLFLAPSETVTQLKENYDGYDLITSRVHTVTPELHESSVITLMGIEIKVLRLEHFGDSPWKEAENIAFLISLDGKKIIHFGDSKIDESSLASFDLQNEEIDVAIIPYWQLGPSPDQKRIIEESIGAKMILAGHIPPQGYTSAQPNIEAMGYKNVHALIKRFEIFIIE